MSDFKEEEQVETQVTQVTHRLRSRGEYGRLGNVEISVDEFDTAHLQVKELNDYFIHHKTQEMPPQINKLMKLFKNISHRSKLVKLLTPFNGKDVIENKALNNDPSDAEQCNVMTAEERDYLMELHNLYSLITILQFSSKYESIDVDVASKLCEASDNKTQLIIQCLIATNDKQVNDFIKQIQNVFDLNDKQMIGIKQRINKYHQCRNLYNAGNSHKLTTDMVIFTITDSAINTPKPNNSDLCKSANYLIRYMKEYINNGNDLEMHLFEYGRAYVPQRISEMVCEKYKLEHKYFNIMRAVMKTWIRNHMLFISQQTNTSFAKVFISNEMIAKFINVMNMNENDNEKVIEYLWLKSKQLRFYKTYKTKVGNLNVIVFWTEECHLVAIKCNKITKSLRIIDFIWHEYDMDENKTLQCGIKSQELPVMNTTGNNMKIKKENETLFIEPVAANSSLNVTANKYVHKAKGSLSTIDEANEYDTNAQTESIHSNAGKYTSKIPKIDKNDNDGKECKEYETETPNENIEIDKNVKKTDKSANDDRKECEEYKAELIDEVSSDSWKMEMKTEWTEMIVNDSVICESFPSKEILYYYLKYTMLIQQIHKHCITFKYGSHVYVIYNTELTHSKNKCIMYIIGVKQENGWMKLHNGFMNANQINNVYGIKIPIATRSNSRKFKAMYSFKYSSIPCKMYANLPPIKTNQKKKQPKNIFEIKLTKLYQLVNDAINSKCKKPLIVTFDKTKQKCFIDRAIPIQLDNNNWCFIVYRECKAIKIGIDCNDIKIKSKLFNPKSNIFKKKYDYIKNNITRLHIINDQKSTKVKQIMNGPPRSQRKTQKWYNGIISKYNTQNGELFCYEFEQPLFFLKTAFKSSDYNKIEVDVVIRFQLESGSEHLIPRVYRAEIIENNSYRNYGMCRRNGYNPYQRF